MLYTLPIVGHLAYFRAGPSILMRLQQAYTDPAHDAQHAPHTPHAPYAPPEAHELPRAVCFRDAVLGTDRSGVTDRDMAEHIVQGLEIDTRTPESSVSDGLGTGAGVGDGSTGEGITGTVTACGNYKRVLTILQRTNRRITNIPELERAARVAVASTERLVVNVVKFGGLGLQRQTCLLLHLLHPLHPLLPTREHEPHPTNADRALLQLVHRRCRILLS